MIVDQQNCFSIVTLSTVYSIVRIGSRSSINTAGTGSQFDSFVIEGVKDAKAFRQLVMDQKRGGLPAPGQQRLSAFGPNSTFGSSDQSEITRLLQDIAESNRGILNGQQRLSAKLSAVGPDSTFGSSDQSEVTSLLQDIAESNRGILNGQQQLSAKLKALPQL